MANSYIQVRVEDSDKERAGAILEGLGTNLSMVINMLLKQIILTEGIPFEIKMNKKYTLEDLELLEHYNKATPSEKELIRRTILEH